MELSKRPKEGTIASDVYRALGTLLAPLGWLDDKLTGGVGSSEITAPGDGIDPAAMQQGGLGEAVGGCFPQGLDGQQATGPEPRSRIQEWLQSLKHDLID